MPGWLSRHHLATRAPGGKSSLRDTLGLFLPAIGSGMSLHPCRPRPLGASLRLAPAFRKRLSDLQPDQGIAESPQLV
ncbi:hypothetical protein [Enterobacter intestinihominis]|uniref:hypothetical protein n=1 Tax=Enterobacter intestinihominis TaxID=3133180 RepID=UPI003B435D77